ncbi:putative uncharacterized protein [Clostridium sp. CAG:1013]|jgi:GntR family transcriptional regulator|nr:putative uncharacterized protein [Clostridium sp. CAG:1013]
MELDFNSEKTIFQQIADWLEDSILSGAFPEESQIPSTTEFSVLYKINPATALKGINLLVDEGVVYKKRGVGMFVATGAVEKLRAKRKESFYDHFVASMIGEAKRLGMSREELAALIDRGFAQEQKEETL